MSFSSFLSDTKAVRERGEYFVQLYPKNSLSVETPLYFSRRGTATPPGNITVGSDTLNENTPYIKRLITAPTLTQSIWQSGRILSRSLPSFGTIQLDNRDGGLDIYHPSQGYTFTDCRYKVFFADKSDIANTIGKIADGYMANINFDMESVSIDTQGRESLFEQFVSERVYRGTGYMLELSGVRTVSYGTPAAVDLTGSMTLEGWTWVDTTPAANVTPVWGWTNAGWRLNLTTSRQFSFRQAVAGVTQGPTQTTGIPAQTFCHIAIVISGTTLTFYTYNDDTQVTTTEVVTNAFTSSTRDIHSAGVYEHNSASTLVQWWDECRVWNYARTLAEIEADRFRELVSVPATCVHYVKFNDGTGTTVVDSSATAANGAISGAGTSTWLWSNEGGPELTGTPKPDVWGERWGVAPVLVDPVRQGYQVAGGGAIQDITSYEGGNAHTMSSAASYRAYLTTTPGAGASLRYLPWGLFKLGSSPTLPISALVKGYNGGSLGYVNTGGKIIRDIVTRRGPKLTDPTDLDTSLFTSYESANTAICGLALYDKTSIATALDMVTSSARGWWGYRRSDTLFGIHTFVGPTGTANYNFTQQNIVSITPMQPNGVVYQVAVLYRKNDVVLNEAQVAVAVKSTLNWQQWTLDWQREEATDSTLKTANAVSIEIQTTLQYRADAKALAEAVLALVKGKKYGWSLVVTAVGLQATIDEICTVSVTQQNKTIRLGLDGTRKYSIMTVEDRPQSGTVKMDLWG